jgi:hypothetical protein
MADTKDSMTTATYRDALPQTTVQRVRELVELGPDHVTADTEIHALVYMARAYVKREGDLASRAVARAAEERAREAQRAQRPKRRTLSEIEAGLVAESFNQAALNAIVATRDRWVTLQDQEFKLPDGTVTTWADASVDDHLARASSQRSMMAGIDKDAVLHERAASDLQTFGIYRLSDLNDESLRAAVISSRVRAVA